MLKKIVGLASYISMATLGVIAAVGIIKMAIGGIKYVL